MPKIFQRIRGGSYYVRLYSHGKERKLSLRTSSKREAERRAGRLIYGTLPAILQSVIDAPKTTLAEAWEEYLKSDRAKALKPSSRHTNAAAFADLAEDYPKLMLEDITVQIATEHIKKISERASVATAQIHKAILNGIWKTLLHLHPGLVNPWPSTPPMLRPQGEGSRTQALSDDEIDELFKHLKGVFRDMALLALHTGARLKDVITMRHEYRKGDYLEFLPCKTSRRGRPVRIPLHPDIMPLFKASEGFLWPSEAERYERDPTWHSVALRRAFVEAGIKGERKGFHALRATFISRLEKAGVERRKIQAAVGHMRDEQTGKYSDIALEFSDIVKAQNRTKPSSN